MVDAKGEALGPGQRHGYDQRVGSYMFVSTPGFPPVELRAHEYIHKLQYESNLLTFGKYVADSVILSAFGLPVGGPTYPTEAIAYLWESWALSYHRWEFEPWEIWRPL